MWTLVYRYKFTENEGNFFTTANAVYPRPDWPASDADVAVSKVSPTHGIGAVEFNMWEDIGSTFLITSNINDWMVCTPMGGSLVRPANGTIKCQNIKDVALACSNKAPEKISWRPCGPRLFYMNTMYLFDGSTTTCFPTHNPCTDRWRNTFKTGVENPGGSIYLKT